MYCEQALEELGHDGEFYRVEMIHWADDSFQHWESARLLCDALPMRYQLLSGAWVVRSEESLRAAESLQALIGAFSCGMWGVDPYNEYGFRRCTIMHAGSAQRLHSQFEQTEFEPLRPLFAEHCHTDDHGRPYKWITSFEQLMEYAKAFAALLSQAKALDKTLYVCVSY